MKTQYQPQYKSRDRYQEIPGQLGMALLGLSPLILLLTFLLLIGGCGSNAAEQQGPPPAPDVSVAQVLSRDVNPWDEFTGRVEATETVEIRPRVSGYIEQLRYTEGSEVRKGDVLFVIDQRPYRAEQARAEADLARARAQSEQARSEAARAQRLLEARAVSQEEHDQRIAAAARTRADVQAAEAALQTARLNLEFTVVRSPISGRAGQAQVTQGNLVAPGTTLLTTVVSLDPVYVYFEGDERVYLRSADLARRGTRDAPASTVFVGLSNEEGFPHEGALDFVDNQVNAATGTIRARAVVPNADRRFTPGLFARVKLMDSSAVSAILVDEKAILTDQDRKYVYVLGPENKALRRDVKLGRLEQGLRVITEGLAAGDQVIVHGVQKVFFPGMPVQPQTIGMGDPPSAPQVSAAAPEEKPRT
jgi:multidrug efflux system membrane fusion protein